MNNINKVQNSLESLQRLAAQRELYSSAKTLYIIQLIGNILVPVSFSIVSIFNPVLSPYSALYGICFFLTDLILIEPGITTRKMKAAKIQELFDCDVLQLAKSPLKTASDITVEEVLTHYDAHQKIKSNIEKLRDWYPKEISSLGISVARLICQRANCWWDSKLRLAYCNLLRASCLLLVLAIAILGILGKLEFEKVVMIASGLIPFFRFSARQYLDNLAANRRHESLKSFIQTLWDNIISKCINKDSLDDSSRSIQDEIYENRAKSPLILDVFYKFYRSKAEDLMYKSAQILIQEIVENDADIK